MSIIPVHQDPYKLGKAQEAREKLEALKELQRLATLGLSLKRPVFFVPGWTGEGGDTWLRPDGKKNIPARVWMNRVFKNAPTYAVYVNFLSETANCHSFFDFGNVVRTVIGERRPCDCVGHSMGGLDIAAAIALCHPPLMNINNFVTFGSPLRGTEWGETAEKLSRWKLKKLLPYHEEQARNMDPDQPFIKQLQTPRSLKRLFDNTAHIYCFYGSRDIAIRKAGRIEPQDIDPSWKQAPPGAFKEKVRCIVYSGVEHTGPAGITQDPRVVLDLVRVLADIPLPEPAHNHGFVV